MGIALFARPKRKQPTLYICSHGGRQQIAGQQRMFLNDQCRVAIKLNLLNKPLALPSVTNPLLEVRILFELGRQARPGRHTGIRLYRPVTAEGQNKSWGHRLTAKASTY
jgi:hypothetical protein